jgi:hypothetical protein
MSWIFANINKFCSRFPYLSIKNFKVHICIDQFWYVTLKIKFFCLFERKTIFCCICRLWNHAYESSDVEYSNSRKNLRKGDEIGISNIVEVFIYFQHEFWSKKQVKITCSLNITVFCPMYIKYKFHPNLLCETNYVNFHWNLRFNIRAPGLHSSAPPYVRLYMVNWFKHKHVYLCALLIVTSLMFIVMS